MKGKATLKPEIQELTYFDSIEKVTTKAETRKGYFSAKISLPKEWIGKRVLCLLIEEPDTPSK